MGEAAESFHLPASKMITRYGYGAKGLSLIHAEASSMEEREGRLFKEQKNNQGLYSSAYTEPPIRIH